MAVNPDCAATSADRTFSFPSHSPSPKRITPESYFPNLISPSLIILVIRSIVALYIDSLSISIPHRAPLTNLIVITHGDLTRTQYKIIFNVQVQTRKLEVCHVSSKCLSKSR
jgi:hypothetical protein